MRYLAIAFTTILTSFYFFPFEFSFLPGANTKMIMAGFGLVLFFFNMARGGHGKLNRDLFILSGLAICISILSLATVSINNTNDYSFGTYFISMWVWLGGAYTATQLMKAVHGHLSVDLVCKYLIAVCVAQCIIAETMDIYKPIKTFVDSFLGGTEAFMGKAGERMYGIGAALDVAGFRFAAVLIMSTFLCFKAKTKQETLLYILSFVIITAIGSVIGRSTTIGAIISLALLIYLSLYRNPIVNKQTVNQIWNSLILVLLICLPIIIYYYNTDSMIYNRLRFGFEGFFNLFEKGKWETTSTDILVNHMIILPGNITTWIIGDGYCANPNFDPYYTGPEYHGFYMGTDIGYIRFLFYFGIFGLISLVSYITKAASTCMQRFSQYKYLFMMLLVLNLVEWCKVSTDLFLVFALFLCLPAEEESPQPVQTAQNSD